ncbi:MAG: hypothetical protein ACLQVY_01345 [Limisphaerales bacterium]
MKSENFSQEQDQRPATASRPNEAADLSKTQLILHHQQTKRPEGHTSAGARKADARASSNSTMMSLGAVPLF